jgi:outer membrane protein assembly factor BamB
MLSGKHNLPGDYFAQTAPSKTSPSQEASLDWRLLVLCFVVLLPLLAGCTRGIESESSGWNPPASQDGAVYVGTKQGQVKAYIDNGFEGVRESWTFPPPQTQADLGGVFNTPLIVGDFVYVSAQSGFLYAINRETGTMADGGWQRPQGQPEELEPLIAGPAYDPVNDLILAPSEDGRLHAYTAKSGDQAWNPFRTGAAIWSTPAVDDGIGYFGSHDHNIYAVTLNDGKELWHYETGGVVAGKPLVFDGKVIAGSFDKSLYAISVEDGSLEWTFEADNWFWAGAVTDGSTIFAPNMNGSIYALDRNGNLLWQHDIGSSLVSSPVLVPSGLVVAGKEGKLVLLDTGSANLGLQRELSNLSLGDAEVKAPLFADGDSVYVGSQDSTVRRIEIKGGQVVMWCRHTEKTLCENN